MSDPVAAAAFEALLRQTGAGGLLLVDDRLRIRRAGPAAANLAGRPVEDIEGMSLIAAFGSVALDGVARAALSSGSSQSGEAELGQPSARTYVVDAVPLADGGAVLSLHDITTLRRAERVRRDFVANISHELRTPLASIKLLAETLAAGALDDAESGRDFAVRIGTEVDHLAQLVDELLDLARIESGEVTLAITALEPAAVLEGVARRISPVAERREVTVRVLAGPPDGAATRAAADGERLGQALLNLAHNAVKYSHPGGEVRLGWAAEPGTVRFEVADDGVGIPSTHRARIFERFYKVDRSRVREADDEPQRASAGLGLAIVKHIAEAHGGAVGVTSQEGAGSSFWIEVPRAPDGG
ncbi:MAG TPA: ATP-binding protein [Candidatus Limnocylindria bacterium]|jgi:two-component system phosphate regulon sensor histidine kinase PhoR